MAIVISNTITDPITKQIGIKTKIIGLINGQLNLLQATNFHAKPTKIFIKMCPETILANNRIDKLKILDK